MINRRLRLVFVPKFSSTFSARTQFITLPFNSEFDIRVGDLENDRNAMQFSIPMAK